MTLECINPEDLPAPSTYTHVVVATGSRLVFVAGQEPEDVVLSAAPIHALAATIMAAS
jgi:enamine deaminase RidA (YjgF/YER057c/UK114 family)